MFFRFVYIYLLYLVKNGLQLDICIIGGTFWHISMFWQFFSKFVFLQHFAVNVPKMGEKEKKDFFYKSCKVSQTEQQGKDQG